MPTWMDKHSSHVRPRDPVPSIPHGMDVVFSMAMILTEHPRQPEE